MPNLLQNPIIVALIGVTAGAGITAPLLWMLGA